jgi:putative transposase
MQAAILVYRVQNLKKDIYWKLSREIVQENKHVLISRFQVSDMARRMSRNINSETARKMLNWDQFEFRQRLRHKALEYGAVIHEVSEHYTSKTCGKFGRIHCSLGGSNIFICPHCHFTIERVRETSADEH